MVAAKESWEQVGESWRDLGRHMRAEYHKLSENQARESQEDKDKLSEAASRLSEHLGEALRSVRGLVKDPQTKESMERVIDEMGTAIAATFNDAADEIRQRLPGGKGGPDAEVTDAEAAAKNG